MNKYSIYKLPNDILKDIANNFKIIRKQAQLTQSELAKKSGVSLGSLKRFEQSGQVSFHALLKLVHVLDRLDEFEKLLIPKENLERINKLFSF